LRTAIGVCDRVLNAPATALRWWAALLSFAWVAVVHFHSMIGSCCGRAARWRRCNSARCSSMRSLYVLAPELRADSTGCSYFIFMCRRGLGAGCCAIAFHGWTADAVGGAYVVLD